MTDDRQRHWLPGDTIEPDDVAAYRARVCEAKAQLGQVVARRIAADDPTVSAYRCPWCATFHVGHRLSIEALAVLAAMLRVRDTGQAMVVPGGAATPRP